MKSNLEKLELEVVVGSAADVVVSMTSEQEEYASYESAECTASCELALGKYEKAEEMLLFDGSHQIRP